MKFFLAIVIVFMSMFLLCQQPLKRPVPPIVNGYTCSFDQGCRPGRHTGFDYAFRYGCDATSSNYNTPVYASAGGQVFHTQAMFSDDTLDTCSGNGDHGMGNNIVIKHPLSDGQNHLYTSYSHLSNVLVNLNDYVYQGQLIGYIGNSGYGDPTYWTGVSASCSSEYNQGHLHFEVRTGNIADCNPSGAQKPEGGSISWGYTSNAASPTTWGYRNPENYLNDNITSPEMLVSVPDILLPASGQDLVYTGGIGFDWKDVPNANNYRIQVYRIYDDTSVDWIGENIWDPGIGFINNTNECTETCLADMVLNRNTDDVSSFYWDPTRVGEEGVFHLPEVGATYAWSVKSYNNVTQSSTYSYPRYFRPIWQGCSSGPSSGCQNLNVNLNTNVSIISLNGQLEIDVTPTLLPFNSPGVNVTTNIYQSSSPNSFSASDIVGSVSTDLGAGTESTTNTLSLSAPQSGGTIYLHAVVNPDGSVDEYTPDDNIDVRAVLVTSSGQACLPASNLRIAGVYNPTSGLQRIYFDPSPTGMSYRVYVTRVSNNTTTFVTPEAIGNFWRADFPALPGEQYNIYVETTCQNGEAEDSEILPITIAEECSITGFETYQLRYNSVRVRWDETVSGGGYLIKLLDGGGNIIRENSVVDNDYYYGNLDPMTSYSIELRAPCTSGLLITDNIEFETPDFICPAPGAIRDMTNAFGVNFSWDPVPGISNGYAYTWQKNNGETNSGNTFQPQLSVSGLPGQTITLLVSSRCGIFSSDPVSKTVVIPELTCMQVANLRVVTQLSTSLVFDWDDEDDAIYGYNYLLTRNGTEVRSGNTSNSSLVLSGLPSNSNYVLTITSDCAETTATTTLATSTSAGGGGDGDNFTVVIPELNVNPNGISKSGGTVCVVDREKIVFLNTDGSLTGGVQLSAPGETFFVSRVITTSDGNFVAAGDFRQSGNSSDTPGVVKFSTNGTLIFSKKLAGGTSDDEVEDLAEDNNGDLILVGGHKSFQAVRRDAFVIKLNSSGSLVYQKSLGSGLDDRAFAVKIAINGDYILTGRGTDFGGNLTNNDGVFITRLQPNGNLVWSKVYLSSATDMDSWDLTVDNNDNIYLAGNYDQAGLIVKVSSSGSLLGVRKLGGPFDNDDLFGVDFFDNTIFVSGVLHVPNNSDDKMGIIKLTTGLSLLGGSYISSESDTRGRDIIVSEGEVYLVGKTEQFGPEANLEGAIVAKRGIDLTSDCFSIPFLASSTTLSLTARNFNETTSPSYTIIDGGLSVLSQEYSSEDPCGVVCPFSSASVSSNTGCTGEDFILNFTGTDATSVQFIDESSTNETVSGNAATFSYSEPGDYTITVVAENESCVDTYEINVVVTSLPTFTVEAIPPTCPGGNDGLISVVTENGNEVTIGSVTGLMSSGLTADSYLITIENSTGCIVTETVTLIDEGMLPIASIMSTPVGDRRLQFTSIGEGSAYWDFGDGTFGAGQQVTHNYPSGGSYEISLTVTGECGSDTETSTISISCPSQTIEVLSTATCVNNSIALNTNDDGAELQWIEFETGAVSNGTNFNFTPSEEGDYTVQLTASTASCTQGFSITIPVSSPTQTSLLIEDPSCINVSDGSITVLPMTSPFQYEWNDGSSAATRSNLSVGNYSVTVTNGDGCTSVENTVLSPQGELPTISVNASTNDLTVDLTSTISDGTVTWNFGDGNTGSGIITQHTYALAGTYTVLAVVSNQCGSRSVSTTVEVSSVGGVNPFDWPTTSNQTGVVFGQATIEGVPASDQDYVGLFVGDLCVGGGSITVNNGIAYFFNVVLYLDDPSSPEVDGIQENQAFTMRMHDASEDEIVNHSGSYTGWSNANGAPMENFEDFTVIYDFSGSRTQNLQLFAGGYNLISFSVSPENKSIESVFGPLIDAAVLESVSNYYGGSPTFYDPDFPTFLNTLSVVEDGAGYIVRVNEDVTLNITGVPVAVDYRLELPGGWTTVGFLDLEEVGVEDYFDEDITDCSMTKLTHFYPGEGSSFFLCDGPPFLNSLRTLLPGRGYFYFKTEMSGVTPSNGGNSTHKLGGTKFLNDCPPGQLNSTVAVGIAQIDGSAVPESVSFLAYDENNQIVGCGTTIPNGGDVYFQIPVAGNDEFFDGGLDEGENYYVRLITSEGITYSITQPFTFSNTFGSPGPSFDPVRPFQFELQPLPHLLAYFSVDCPASKLQWGMSLEESFSGFVLEYYTEQYGWQQQPFIPAKGNGSHYEYNLLKNAENYRLKMIDNDQTFSFSPLINGCMPTLLEAQLTVYPNPASTFITIQLPGVFLKRELEIFSLDGRRVMTELVDHNQSTVELPIHHLKKGIYAVFFDGRARRFVVQ